MINKSLLVVLIALTFGSRLHADELATKKALTLGITKKIAAAAESFATEKGWNVVIAVVDDGGHLIYLQRMDGTQTGSVAVAIAKAKSAAAFKRPTVVFSDAVAAGANALLGLPGAIPFDGGYPIKAGDEIVGAIGVSGVTGQQDGLIAQAGANSLSKLID